MAKAKKQQVIVVHNGASHTFHTKDGIYNRDHPSASHRSEEVLVELKCKGIRIL